jgi:hypothetical protein
MIIEVISWPPMADHPVTVSGRRMTSRRLFSILWSERLGLHRLKIVAADRLSLPHPLGAHRDDLRA